MLLYSTLHILPQDNRYEPMQPSCTYCDDVQHGGSSFANVIIRALLKGLQLATTKHKSLSSRHEAVDIYQYNILKILPICHEAMGNYETQIIVQLS